MSKPRHIDEVFVFIATDETGESIATFSSPDMIHPMVAADRAHVDSLRQIAQDLVGITGKEIRLCRFTVREEIEVIKPEKRQ